MGKTGKGGYSYRGHKEVISRFTIEVTRVIEKKKKEEKKKKASRQYEGQIVFLSFA